MTTTRLALDCSTAGLSLALSISDGKIYEFSTPAARSSDLLPTELSNLFLNSNTSAAQLTHIYVATGPGSFTGIRLGLATAEALKLLNPAIQIIGLPTLQALAGQVVTENAPTAPFTIATDAAGGQAYTQTFNTEGTPQSEPAVTTTHHLQPQGQLFAPASLMLEAAPLQNLQARHLFTLAENYTAHLPAAPVYLKPLTYKMVE